MEIRSAQEHSVAVERILLLMERLAGGLDEVTVEEMAELEGLVEKADRYEATHFPMGAGEAR